jgi:signal peptidase I
MEVFEPAAPSLTAKPEAAVRRKSLVREYAEALAFALVCTFLIRWFVVQAFRIPSGSMEDTLAVGDFLFVNKLLYGPRVPFLEARLPAFTTPHSGDVLVFKYPEDRTKDFIKRCVAVGGQTVEVRDKELYVDGIRREEPFVKHVDPMVRVDVRDRFGPVIVPPGQLFVMGDNRDLSHDSRYWGFLDRDLVLGKAMFIYWSWDHDRKLLDWIPTPRWERIGDRVR